MSQDSSYHGPINPNPTDGEAAVSLYGFVPSRAFPVIALLTFALSLLAHTTNCIRLRSTRVFEGLLVVGSVSSTLFCAVDDVQLLTTFRFLSKVARNYRVQLSTRLPFPTFRDIVLYRTVHLNCVSSVAVPSRTLRCFVASPTKIGLYRTKSAPLQPEDPRCRSRRLGYRHNRPPDRRRCTRWNR